MPHRHGNPPPLLLVPGGSSTCCSLAAAVLERQSFRVLFCLLLSAPLGQQPETTFVQMG